MHYTTCNSADGIVLLFLINSAQGLIENKLMNILNMSPPMIAKYIKRHYILVERYQNQHDDRKCEYDVDGFRPSDFPPPGSPSSKSD